MRFIRRLPRNRPLLGDSQDLQEFLFGTDRTTLAKVRQLLREHDENRCFYCGSRIRGEGAVDHFVPWALYRLDLGHNYVLADARCNGDKRERLAAVNHLKKWHERNRAGSWSRVLAEKAVPANLDLTRWIAAWAYGQAEQAGSAVWSRGPDGMVGLDSGWRALLAQRGAQ